jgi:hypothetical protein
MNKLAQYYNSEERISELSEYVHKNFHLIQTKMISEMRRKLDITPDMTNSDGYVSLMVTLYGRMFNEMIYGMAGMCQSTDMKIIDIVPKTTFDILFDLIEGKNPLNGGLRRDVREFSREERNAYYLENVEQLRNNLDALPKE